MAIIPGLPEGRRGSNEITGKKKICGTKREPSGKYIGCL